LALIFYYNSLSFDPIENPPSRFTPLIERSVFPRGIRNLVIYKRALIVVPKRRWLSELHHISQVAFRSSKGNDVILGVTAFFIVLALLASLQPHYGSPKLRGLHSLYFRLRLQPLNVAGKKIYYFHFDEEKASQPHYSITLTRPLSLLSVDISAILNGIAG